LKIKQIIAGVTAILSVFAVTAVAYAATTVVVM
jgi:hypothetical protein